MSEDIPTKGSIKDRLRDRLKPTSKSTSRGPSQSPSDPRYASESGSASSPSRIPVSPSPHLPFLTKSLPDEGTTKPLPDSIAPTPSDPSSSRHVLETAINLLSDDDRTVLYKYILPNVSDIDLTLEHALVAAKEKQAYCLEKRWKVKFAGHQFTLKDKADKVIGWLNRFKAVGDVAVNADPIHAGLPWAGIRLLLEAAVSEANQMTTLLLGCELALYMATRLRVYMAFMSTLPSTLSLSQFQMALSRLHACILRFLAKAFRIYQMSSISRAFKAFWQDDEVQVFDQECRKLGHELETEASNCDRTLSEQDRKISQTHRIDLMERLQELEQLHEIRKLLSRLEIKLDLNKIPCAPGALFNSIDEDHTTCHPATRVDILRQIQDWAQDPSSRSIFWLNGVAGTGKSTISWTFAKWLDDRSGSGLVNLGASFFFKRGEGDRSTASRFFPTIVRDLLLKVPGLDNLVAEAVESDPTIFDRALAEQFNKLIYGPLKALSSDIGSLPILIVVVDALDEGEKHSQIETILELWPQLQQITSVQIKLFLTSRPDLPLLKKFKGMPVDAHHDMVLHDEVPRATIREDIFIFLKDAFRQIRTTYNIDPPAGISLGPDWPSDDALQSLVDMSVPLFIVAATIRRYVGDLNWEPHERLQEILEFPNIGSLDQMEQTYLPVLVRMPNTLSNAKDESRFWQDYRSIVGSIVVLAEPLPVNSLEFLLDIPETRIVNRLSPMQSVLSVPTSSQKPIRMFHLSFSEFLLSERLQDKPYGVVGAVAHQNLLGKCLKLLSSSDGLRENICGFQYQGQPRTDLDRDLIDQRLPPAFQYACRYWVHHVQHSNTPIHDDDEVHVFLQKHFLHWLEALSIMSRLAEAIGLVKSLQSSVSASDSAGLSSFLEDAQRIVLAYGFIVDVAPLQIYTSMIFAPQQSILRKICSWRPGWLRDCPKSPEMWDAMLQEVQSKEGAIAFSPTEALLAFVGSDGQVWLWDVDTGQVLQKLQGHSSRAEMLSFSPDGTILASGYIDGLIKLWNPATGQNLVTFRGFIDSLKCVVFSPTGKELASASRRSINIWNSATGQTLRTLKGHTSHVTGLSFSSCHELLASASYDETIKLWNPNTGEELRTLSGQKGRVESVVFSPDGKLVVSGSFDGTIKMWDPLNGQELKTIRVESDLVFSLAFSPNGAFLASGFASGSVQIWDPVTGDNVRTLRRHPDGMGSVAYSADGQVLASVTWGGTIRLWSLSFGQLQDSRPPQGHGDSVNALTFSPNGKLLASASWDGTIKIWNPAAEHDKELKTIRGHGHGILSIAFSPEGTTLASGSWDGQIKLWSSINDEAPESKALRGHSESIEALVFSPDGISLASVSSDRGIIIWNVASSENQGIEITTALPALSVIGFSLDGTLLALWSSNQNHVEVWDLVKAQKVRVLKFVNLPEGLPGIKSLSFTTDSRVVVNTRQARYVENESGLCLDEYFELSKFNTYQDWIQHRGRNLIWLPPDYRARCSAVFEDMVVIGCLSGRVYFYEFDLD